MVITIINVSEPTQVAGKTPYYTNTVSYENEFGKLEQKKLVSFTFPGVWNLLKGKQRGDKVEITRVKNDKGFWDWTAAHEVGDAPAAPETAGARPPIAGAPPESYTKPKSNYETTEERAWRQILIVRQSSVSAAVAALKDVKVAPQPEQVIAFAERLEQWVNRKPSGTEALIAMENDIPV